MSIIKHRWNILGKKHLPPLNCPHQQVFLNTIFFNLYHFLSSIFRVNFDHPNGHQIGRIISTTATVDHVASDHYPIPPHIGATFFHSSNVNIGLTNCTTPMALPLCKCVEMKDRHEGFHLTHS